MKKVISVLSGLLIAMILFPIIIFAGQSVVRYTEGTLYYIIDDESITITGCFGKDANVTVPASIAGIPVNTIATGAFADNDYIKTVNLPDTIMTVQEGAFDDGITVNFNSNIKKENEKNNEEIISKPENNTPKDDTLKDDTSKDEKKIANGNTDAAESELDEPETELKKSDSKNGVNSSTNKRNLNDSEEVIFDSDNEVSTDGEKIADGATEAAEIKPDEEKSEMQKLENRTGDTSISSSIKICILIVVVLIGITACLVVRYKKR